MKGETCHSPFLCYVAASYEDFAGMLKVIEVIWIQCRICGDFVLTSSNVFNITDRFVQKIEAGRVCFMSGIYLTDFD
jgi:hypothetical protein